MSAVSSYPSARSALLMMSRYHLWANRQVRDALVQARSTTTLAAFEKEPDGTFFGSILNTVSHIAGVDDLWYRRLTTGDSSFYNALYADTASPAAWAALFQDIDDASDALVANANRWMEYVAALPEARLNDDVAFRDTEGVPVTQQRAACLFHVFNHGTHHRGQIHAALTRINNGELRALAPSLDLPLIGKPLFRL